MASNPFRPNTGDSAIKNINCQLFRAGFSGSPHAVAWPPAGDRKPRKLEARAISREVENFRNLHLDLHIPSAANMDTGSLLLASVRKVLDDVVKGPIVDEEKICVEKFRKHR
jgi:hypothetical protein